jgi:UDP-GlcNAc:undecaprenyl-phosphate GlcNAc-1-phosphate transferase
MWNLLNAALGLVCVSFLVSVVLCGLIRRHAPALGFLDRPGGRKAHARVTPLGGGVAFWAATVLVVTIGFGTLALAPSWLPDDLARHAAGARSRVFELVGILGLATVIMVIGLVDDRIGLGWRIRLLAQILLATGYVFVWSHVTLFPPFSNPWISRGLTVLWIVGLTNAFNFLDNMDGLAGSVGLIAASLFAAAQLAVGSLFVPAMLFVLAGALGGFLVHNRPPARLFMGDAGSNFLGFLLGCLTVAGTFTRAGYSPYGVFAPLLIMAVPLYDSISVILIRLREGRSPFEADRRHLSHRLVDRGLTPAQAVATIDLVTLASGLGAILLHQLTPVGVGLVFAQTACLLGVVAMLERPPRSGERVDVEVPSSPE